MLHGFGKNKIAAIPAIKAVIENGDIVSHTENYQSKGYNRYVIAARGKIDGIDAILGVVINSYDKSNKFYLHEVELIKADVSSMTAPQLSVDTVNTSASIGSISDFAENVNRKSTKDQSPIDAYYASVIRENSTFQNIFAMMQDTYSSMRGEVELDNKDIRRIARELQDRTSTKKTVRLDEITDKITVLYDYMLQGKQGKLEVDWDTLYSAALNLSNDLINKSEGFDTMLYDETRETRQYLRETQIYIPEDVKKEIAYYYGDYNAFRKMMMGKLNLTTSNSGAVSINDNLFWQQLVEEQPGYFNPDENDLDKIFAIADFFDKTGKKLVNPYKNAERYMGLNIEEEASIMAYDILNGFLDTGTAETANQKIRNAAYLEQQKLAGQRNELRRELTEAKAQNAAEYKQKLADYRNKREQRDSMNVKRRKINRTFNYLNRRLNTPNKKEHIPQHMRQLVSRLNFILD